MKSHDVRFWAIRRNTTAKGASYTVRWTVAGRERSHTLAGRARAERYKSRLLQAADKGEAFDVESGLVHKPLHIGAPGGIALHTISSRPELLYRGHSLFCWRVRSAPSRI